MPWQLSVRAGPRVQRKRFGTLQGALDALEARASQAVRDARRQPVNVRVRRFEPADQVAARLELAGPERWLPAVRAGLDVRGDGSTEAYLGRVRRRALEVRGAETAAAALRRELLARAGPGQSPSPRD